jgi:hypothetical protein
MDHGPGIGPVEKGDDAGVRTVEREQQRLQRKGSLL